MRFVLFERKHFKMVYKVYNKCWGNFIICVTDYHKWHLRAMTSMRAGEVWDFPPASNKLRGDFLIMKSGLIFAQRERSNKRFTTWTIKVQVLLWSTTCIKAVISLHTNGVRSFCGRDNSIHGWNADFNEAVRSNVPSGVIKGQTKGCLMFNSLAVKVSWPQVIRKTGASSKGKARDMNTFYEWQIHFNLCFHRSKCRRRRIGN